MEPFIIKKPGKSKPEGTKIQLNQPYTIRKGPTDLLPPEVQLAILIQACYTPLP